MFKKFFICLMAMLMATSLFACGNNTTPSDTQPTESQPPEFTNTNPEEDAPPLEITGTSMVEGVAYNPYETAQHIKGIRLKGNVLGSANFNNREYSLTNIRCIFELNEWIEFDVDAESLEEPLHVYVINHLPFVEDYKNGQFEGVKNDNYAAADLEKDSETGIWGRLCLSPEIIGNNTYDFLFFVGDQLELVVPIRFYQEGTMAEKSDAELGELIKEFKNN